MKTKSNKTIVLECYRKVIRDLDLSAIDHYISDNYIQHSPAVKDGKAGLFEMLTYLKTLPGRTAPATSPIIRVIAEGEFVAVHLDVNFQGKRRAVLDLYRLKDGMLAEHWDAGQEQPAEDDLISMTNGSTVIEDSADAEVNKRLIAGLFNGDADWVTELLTPRYIEHSKERGLLEAFACDLKLYRIIIEGNFVVTQSKLVETGATFSRFDIFKLEDNLIAEHWSVQQEVPEKMAHSNGML